MASSNLPDVPMRQIQLTRDSFDVPVSLLEGGAVLIPVELPERPTEAISSPSSYVEISMSSLAIDRAELTRLSLQEESSLRSPLAGRRADELRDSPSSPHSDTSKHSEESVLIVGDIFAAPLGLKFSLEGVPNLKNAGVYDRYGRPTGPQSASGSPLTPSISFTRRRTEPIIPVTPKSISPKAKQRPLPTPPIAPRTRSPFIPAHTSYPSTPGSLSPSASMARPKVSPNGPRPRGNSVSSEGTTKSAKKRRRRRSSAFSPPDDNTHGQPVHPTMHASASGVSSSASAEAPAQGLNPFAASFEPGGYAKLRAFSLTGGPSAGVNDFSGLTANNRVYDSNTYHHDPFQTHSVNPFPSLNYSQHHNVAQIQQDLPHLRQWSTLFRNDPATLAEQREHLARLQMQLQYEQQRHAQTLASLALGQPRDGFGTHQSFPYPYPQYVFPNQNRAISPRFFIPQEAPSINYDSRRSSYAHYSSSSGSSIEQSVPLVTPSVMPGNQAMLNLTPVQLPEASFSRPAQATISPPEHNVQKNIVERTIPPQRDITPVISPPPAPPKPANNATGGSTPKGLKLTERGTTSLTPVTERSEISSSANVSDLRTPERTPTPVSKQDEDSPKKSRSRRTRKKIAAKTRRAKGT